MAHRRGHTPIQAQGGEHNAAMHEEEDDRALYDYVPPLLVLLAVIVAISAAVLVIHGLGASHTVYTVAQVEDGLARHRANWTGRVVTVQGRILMVGTSAPNPTRHAVTLRRQTLPLYVLECPSGATQVTSACRAVPGQGPVSDLGIVKQSGSGATLYLGLRSANPAQDRSTLWVQNEPPIGDPLLQLLHVQPGPAPLVWGRVATYRIVFSPARPRRCPLQICVDGFTLGVLPPPKR